MRIFISHATKNKKIALKFAGLLESISSEIEVFCSSEDRSIDIGANYIKKIFDELNTCDLFVPILSKEYYASRFCMIELGVAYSYLFNRYEKEGEGYIFPFALYPITKQEALAGTPMMNIQSGDMTNIEDVKNLLDYLITRKGICVGSGVNRKLQNFNSDLEQLLLKPRNIIKMARCNTYFDDRIIYKRKEDIVNAAVSENHITINFNLNPYGEKKVKYPSFISIVLNYVDKIDFNYYLEFNHSAKFNFELISLTEAIKNISIEFKYSDNNKILETFTFPIKSGKNKLEIPLERMRSKALSQISEICFVIHPEDTVKEKGSFQISNIEIR